MPNRTEAVQHRIDTAGLRRKVGKNQTKAIRIILTGTHEQMMKIANDGRLNSWIDANLKWLKDTFGEENLVSCVLHMDEKTPHLHATVVPIVTGERIRRKRGTAMPRLYLEVVGNLAYRCSDSSPRYMRENHYAI